MNMSVCSPFNEQNKGLNLLSISTWSVLGKQNVLAKKVYSSLNNTSQTFLSLNIDVTAWIVKGHLIFVISFWKFHFFFHTLLFIFFIEMASLANVLV